MSEKAPCGVVGIFIDPDGRVIETTADFDIMGYGGLSLKDAQALRVRKKLALKVAYAMCSEAFVKALTDYDLEKTVHALTRQGYKAVYLEVGYEEGKPDE